MATKKTSPLMEETTNPDEYQYSEEGMSNEDYLAEPTATQKQKGIFSIFQSKRLWIAIVAVLAIVVIAKVMQSRSKIDEIVAPNVSNEKAAAANFKPEVTSENKVQIQPNVTTDQGVAQQVNELKHQNQMDENQLQKLQANVSSMKGDIVRTERTTDSLNSSVQALTKQVQQLTSAVQAQTAKPIVNKPVAPKKPYVKPLTFTIKALMPGRAWLQANNGKTLTVKVGDKLKDVGVVQLIDINRGIVLTSSGRILRYGGNDE